MWVWLPFLQAVYITRDFVASSRVNNLTLSTPHPLCVCPHLTSSRLAYDLTHLTKPSCGPKQNKRDLFVPDSATSFLLATCFDDFFTENNGEESKPLYSMSPKVSGLLQRIPIFPFRELRAVDRKSVV